MTQPTINVANIIEEGRFGGPQKQIAEVARQLKEHGVETTVIYPKFLSDTFKKQLDDYGINNFRLPLHKLTRDWKHIVAYFFFLLYEILLLRRYFKEGQYKIIHCHGSMQIKGVIAGRLAGIKTIWHLNDSRMPIDLRWLFRFMAPRIADGLIVTGKRVRKYYVDQLGLSQMKITEIQAPVDTKAYDPLKANKNDTISQAEGLSIVYVSNINRVKAQEYFIQMAAYLNKRYDGLKFFIVGSVFKTQERYQKKLLKMKDDLEIENLSFYGPSQDIAGILNATDIFVLTSISEASPMAVWEAMSMGRAIVSTDVGDVACFIDNKENGFVVPIRDTEALAERVGVLIEDPGLRQLFGEKARETAKRSLDIEIVTRKHIVAYQAVLQDGSV